MPKRLQRQRTRGWRMPAGAVYVGRPTKWGNPHRLDDHPHRTREMVTRWFREDLKKLLQHRPDALEPLRGRDLVCWCPVGQPCHADVLLEFANRETGHA